MSTSDPAWSYSKLKNSETCGKRFGHYDIIKDVKDPDTSEIIEGRNLHKHFEDRLLKGTELPLGYGMHERMLAGIVAAPGKTVGEQKLAITSAFWPTTWMGRDVWFRSIIDAGKLLDDSATIFDWKTGKVPDPVDETQLELMAAVLFAHLPKLVRVKAALVFVNAQHVHPATYIRQDVPGIWDRILPRVRAMQDMVRAHNFPPNPSGLCKRYCGVQSCLYFQKGAPR